MTAALALRTSDALAPRAPGSGREAYLSTVVAVADELAALGLDVLDTELLLRRRALDLTRALGLAALIYSPHLDVAASGRFGDQDSTLRSVAREVAAEAFAVDVRAMLGLPLGGPGAPF
ncbi:MAG: hypothetical protein RID81_07280 [Sandaracinaceae bacterium]